ncbi:MULTISPECIES: hypothetical protein [unclassified Adlercreutzia]|uniref:hypothetical protein n=1 Tax=unclassified Adlercreutzia TaxID=2636013 RepID=UPI0013EAD14F|nr:MULTISPECIES: hypothetical protein [unclassified Adlercreutzia]
MTVRKKDGDTGCGDTILRVARNLGILYIALVVIAVIVLSPAVSYACKAQAAFLSPAYVLIAALVGLGFILLLQNAKRLVARYSLPVKMENDRLFFVVVVFSSIMLLVVQAFVVRSCWFVTGWDVAILANIFDPPALYYSTYPNQLFLVGLFARIASWGASLGFDNGYLCVVVGSCLCTTASIALTSFAAKRLGGCGVGYAFLLLSSVFVGLSPWILVPYSDTYGMLWTTVLLFSYVCVDRRILKWSIISFSAVVGYSIKPTVLFVFLAILVVEGVRFCCRARSAADLHLKSGMMQTIALLAPVFLSLGLAFYVTSRVSDFDLCIDDNAAFSSTHFLMMGFNSETMGIWSEDDVYYSMSFERADERMMGNIQVWLERVDKLGPVGVAKLLTKKTLSNYADGTFAWEMEGSFYLDTHGRSELLKSIYGIDDTNPIIERTANFAPIAQIVWMFVLLGVVLCVLKRNPDDGETVAFLALFMLSVFLTLFECRARYLFLYMPYFIVLAVLGWSRLGRHLRGRGMQSRRMSERIEPCESPGRHELRERESDISKRRRAGDLSSRRCCPSAAKALGRLCFVSRDLA